MIKKIYMRHKNDCYTCCLAMILGLEYEQVPRFFDDDNIQVSRKKRRYHKEVDKFLNSVGHQLVVVNSSLELLNHLQGLIIVTGLSPNPEFASRGMYHATVYLDGKLWCDPKSESPEGFIIPDQIDLLIPIRKLTYGS